MSGAGPVDRLGVALLIAGEVLADYGDDPSDTRIERLARCLIHTLGDERCEYRPEVIYTGQYHLKVVVGIPLDWCGYKGPDEARRMAAALIYAAEIAEG